MTLPRIVTTSWDDSDLADLRIAELLEARGINGTFYIPFTRPDGPCQERPALTNANVRSLSQSFEIGAHSMTHRPLRGISVKELNQEVVPCKGMLEDMVGKRVQMFCYPCGRFDANVIRALQGAGYSGARTVRMLATRLDFDAFEMPTTVQSFAHVHSDYLRNMLRARKLQGLQLYLAKLNKLVNWVELSKALFDDVIEHGGIWHMYGHSWEVDYLGLWEDLKQVLDYVSRREGVLYLNNAELLPFRAGHPAIKAREDEAVISTCSR